MAADQTSEAVQELIRVVQEQSDVNDQLLTALVQINSSVSELLRVVEDGMS
tara:strand:- start:8269 stop:8421 length:153 start_codon:yes stop_codon:yes gene_type:complete